MSLFFSFILAMFVTMSLMPLLIRSAARLNLVDIPNHRKVHSGAIPRIGGIAMVAGSVLPMVLWLNADMLLLGLLLGSVVIFVFGFLDDRKNLNYRIKFLGQSIGVLVVILVGDVRIDIIPLAGLEPVPSYVSIPVTFIFLIGITNAINLADGLDGLAGGTMLLSFGAIALLGYIEQNYTVVLTAVAVLGSILGFLRFNTHPAEVFMGDGGSQFLGFAVGVCAILLTQHDSALSPALPILLLGLPILDTFMVMAQRVYENRSPFSPDKNHIHHKLLALGFDHYEAVFVIYVMQSLLVINAYYFRYNSDEFLICLYLTLSAFVIAVFRVANLTGWRLRSGGDDDNARPLLAISVGRFNDFQKQGILTEWMSVTAGLIISIYFLVVVLSVPSVLTTDLAVLTVFLVLAAGYLRIYHRQNFAPWTDRAYAYVVCTLIVYLQQKNMRLLDGLYYLTDVFFFVLAVTVAIGFRYAKNKNFKFSTLDFLVLFVAFSVPNLPSVNAESELSGAIVKLIVLFYATELIMCSVKIVNWVRYVSLTTLGLLVIKAII